MDMLKLVLAKILLGYILQSITYVLGVYAVNKRKIDIKLFSIATLIFSLATYAIRETGWIKIDFGVHTLLLLMVIILLGVGLLKNNIYPTALAAIIVSLSVIISETVTALCVSSILGSNNVEKFFANEFNKAAAVIPANLALFAIV